MRWIHHVAVGLLALVPFVPLTHGEESKAASRVAFDSIKKSDLIRHITYLASDELEGRASGSKGCYLAGDYIARNFKQFGLKPAGDGGTYFQKFGMGAASGLGKNNRLSYELEGEWSSAKVSSEFLPFPFSATKSATGELVFAGYGITAKEQNYDDYAGLDVKGKIVLIYRHEPREKEDGEAFQGRRNTRHAFFTTKIRNAQERGAVALLVVNDPHNHSKDELFGYRGQGDASVKIPVVHIKQSLARRLFESAGKDLLKTQRAIDKDLAPKSFGLGLKVKVSADLKKSRITARNVLGLLEGSDPVLKKEIVVVGGHYDHLGYGHFGSLGGRSARNSIHNGADDNASGTSVVLELAEAFQRAGIRPRRSILFMGFTGEERGLVGSRYYVKNPIFPLENTVAMINLDMVGRGKTGKFQVNGVGTSPLWPSLVKMINDRLGTQATYGQSGYAPSDNTSFYEKNIPVLFFFTGLHKDYHRPTDDVPLINQDQVELIGRYAFATLYYLAEVVQERPGFTQTRRRSGPRGNRGGGVFLGVQGGEQQSEQGFLVGGVTPDSAAAKAGVKAGDVITHFDGKKISGIQQLIRVIRGKKVGDVVLLKVLRNDEQLTLKAKLGRRGR